MVRRPDLAKDGQAIPLCSSDQGWCVAIGRDVDARQAELRVFPGPAQGQAVMRHALAKTPDDKLAVWPQIIRLSDGGLLVGVEHQTTVSYSGGGGSASTLELFRFSGDVAGKASPVLTLPIEAAMTIRACFDEKDPGLRLGACQDKYTFDTELTLDPTAVSGPPRLVVQTRATAFPAGATRQGDSSQRGQLNESDLKVTTDPVCSYRRVMTFDPRTGTYAPDAPLPNCEDFTEP